MTWGSVTLVLVGLSCLAQCLAEADRHPHPPPSYHPAPAYTPAPAYKPRPSYHPAPAYKPRPTYHQPAYKPAPTYKHHEPAVPACAANTTKPWCLEDTEYPTYEIKHAANANYEKLLSLYADVADLNTELSVERPNILEEETYLCPSETAYVQPLRAINSH